MLSVLLFGDAMCNQCRIGGYYKSSYYLRCDCYDACAPAGAGWLEFQYFILGSGCSQCQEHFSRFFVSVTGFQVQTASSSGCTIYADSHPKLIQFSLQPSPIPNYHRAWKLYPVCLYSFSFCIGLFAHFTLKFRFAYRLHASAQLRSFNCQHVYLCTGL